MKINFKQPKYVLPLLALPFLCLFFYVWQSTFDKPKTEVKQQAGLNGNVGNVSADVRKKALADKLDAYRNTYKEADGYSAVNVIPKEVSGNPGFKDNYTGRERQMLDSIDRAMKAKYNAPQSVSRDKALAGTLNTMPRRRILEPDLPSPKEKDPMEVFKQQMAYMDSVGKMNDPAYKAEKLKQQAAEKAAQQKSLEKRLTVTRADTSPADFNTVKPAEEDRFISAVIDENVTGYAGSRLRLKLLEDIKAGGNLIRKGTYLFAQISGFSEQRVTLGITTILSDGKILPVKLEIYDLDGMPGLYVPSSAFREFTKDLGSSSVQGVTIDGNSTGSQFIMSSVDKLFQSTSSAIAGLIRKNKAKMKYNSYIYLIDTDALQNTQKSY
ncbi:Bacteroides conjugative transposon TraM protein [Mucilaginibacter sp. OK268]|uniref:conjugative transposon protein TraM n=1 Tax=Mucilaginibacter sp. OK268 TaxID=1881048 RepID=UPI00087F4707|nr:conjugative transposon protein TraM [Mucilaginibacter sp. OK268]SDP46950.1 Bacteroides conjugative transposon TraM protein [Mucilaginibacter sp. OK268]